jgi:hypothetical protein
MFRVYLFLAELSRDWSKSYNAPEAPECLTRRQVLLIKQ